MAREHLRWDDLQLFLNVAESGSFSAAARQLRLAQPTLSRRIAELEESVGEPLFQRQAQGCRLTAAGQRLLPSARRMAEWALEADTALSRPRERLEGKVRVAAPPRMAFELLAPLAAQLQLQQPGLRLEALSGIETLNLARGEADLALRTSRPSDKEVLILDQISCPIVAYASPAYAARLPAPPQQLGLAQLDWIAWAPPYEEQQVNQALAAAIPGFRPAFSSDDYLVQLAACRAGVGVLVMARALHRHSALEGLVELPVPLGEHRGDLFLVSHQRSADLPRVRHVAALISTEFELLRQTPGVR
ncbi:LysR family transcriptional regulator [Roseateles sp. DB2]|uniref:LysR family transcriptional regulator n=1 Tax=Roseateles sp. DB2 TaxID=3453717 RepID=UPI003EEE3D84